MEIKTYLTNKGQFIEYKINNKNIITDKKCTKCLEWRLIEEYPKTKGSFADKYNECNYCERERQKNLRRAQGSKPKKPPIEIINGISCRACTNCLKVKPFEEFRKVKKGFMGYDNLCKECDKLLGEIERRNKGIKPVKTIAILKDENGIITHKECSSCHKMLEFSKFNKSKNRKYQLSPCCKNCKNSASLMRKYGISLDQKKELAIQQNYKCKICEKEFSFKDLLIDHCHTTNKIRGLLCNGCNSSMGNFKEKISILENCIKYVEFHNKNIIPTTDEERNKRKKERQKALYKRDKRIIKTNKVSILKNKMEDITHRECFSCSKMLPLIEFDKHKHSTLGVRSWCKNCSAERNLFVTYGIFLKDKEEMYNKQNEKCVVCESNKNINDLCVDHCHISDKIRSLLCNECNRALGGVKENITTLKNMIKYIENKGIII